MLRTMARLAVASIFILPGSIAVAPHLLSAQVNKERVFGQWAAGKQVDAMSDAVTSRGLTQESGRLTLKISCVTSSEYELTIETSGTFGDSTSRLRMRHDGGPVVAVPSWEYWTSYGVIDSLTTDQSVNLTAKAFIPELTAFTVKGAAASRIVHRLRAQRSLAVEITPGKRPVQSARQAVFSLSGLTAAMSWLGCD